MCGNYGNLPSNADSKGTVLPVPTLDQRHLPVDVRTRAIQDIVGMAVAIEGIIVRVTHGPVVRVRMSHYSFEYRYGYMIRVGRV